jgi:hypothetical protein
MKKKPKKNEKREFAINPNEVASSNGREARPSLREENGRDWPSKISGSEVKVRGRGWDTR